MELKDTVELMDSKDFKDRFIAEYNQLKIRKVKLSVMLLKYRQGNLSFNPKCSYDLLHEQLIYMESYLKVLEKRAEIENISLQEVE